MCESIKRESQACFQVKIQAKCFTIELCPCAGVDDDPGEEEWPPPLLLIPNVEERGEEEEEYEVAL